MSVDIGPPYMTPAGILPSILVMNEFELQPPMPSAFVIKTRTEGVTTQSVICPVLLQFVGTPK